MLSATRGQYARPLKPNGKASTAVLANCPVIGSFRIMKKLSTVAQSHRLYARKDTIHLVDGRLGPPRRLLNTSPRWINTRERYCFSQSHNDIIPQFFNDETAEDSCVNLSEAILVVSISRGSRECQHLNKSVLMGRYMAPSDDN